MITWSCCTAKLKNPSCQSGDVHKVRYAGACPHSQQPQQSTQRKCYRCDNYHSPDTCKFKTLPCHFCGLYKLFDQLNSLDRVPPITKWLHVQNTDIEFEINTESSFTIIPRSQLEKIQSKIKLKPCTIAPKMYTGLHVHMVGSALLNLRSGSRVMQLEALISRNQGLYLLGRHSVDQKTWTEMENRTYVLSDGTRCLTSHKSLLWSAKSWLMEILSC